MTDHRTPDERSMSTKLLGIMEGDGEGDGLTLTAGETAAFKRMLDAMHQRQLLSDMQLVAIRDAHIRDGVEVVHQEHDDGSVSYHLQHKPQPTTDAPETVN